MKVGERKAHYLFTKRHDFRQIVGQRMRLSANIFENESRHSRLKEWINCHFLKCNGFASNGGTIEREPSLVVSKIRTIENYSLREGRKTYAKLSFRVWTVILEWVRGWIETVGCTRTDWRCMSKASMVLISSFKLRRNSRTANEWKREKRWQKYSSDQQ